MRKFVIPDIHGCKKTFVALLKKIGLTREDKLFLLGDYIDRGPDSAGVLNEIIYLQQLGYRLFPLMGNHEYNLLQASTEYDTPTFVHFVSRINKSPELLTPDGKIIHLYKTFLQTLPFYHIEDDFILVHAGLQLNVPDPFADCTAMLEYRGNINLKEHAVTRHKYLVHGHVPAYLNDIKCTLRLDDRVIPLDNGCVYTQKHKIYDVTKLGNLLCLELNTLSLTVQKNVEEG